MDMQNFVFDQGTEALIREVESYVGTLSPSERMVAFNVVHQIKESELDYGTTAVVDVTQHHS